MSDDDMIRRGDAVKAVPSGWNGQPHQSNMDYGPNVAAKAIAAIRAIPATDARADALREAADLFQLHPWSWSAKEIRAKILALIETRKEVMPIDEDPIDARPATSPGVTAGATCGQCGMRVPCGGSECKHPLSGEART